MSQNNERDLNLRTLGSLTISILAHAGLLAVLLFSPKMLEISQTKGSGAGQANAVAYVQPTAPKDVTEDAADNAPKDAPKDAPENTAQNMAESANSPAAVPPQPELNASPAADDVAAKPAPKPKELPVKEVARKAVATPAPEEKVADSKPEPKVKAKPAKIKKVKSAKSVAKAALPSKKAAEKSALPESLSPELETTDQSEVAIKEVTADKAKVESTDAPSDSKVNPEMFTPKKQSAAPVDTTATPEPILSADPEVKALDEAKPADKSELKEVAEPAAPDVAPNTSPNAPTIEKVETEKPAEPLLEKVAEPSTTPSTSPSTAQAVEEAVESSKDEVKEAAKALPKSSDEEFVAKPVADVPEKTATVSPSPTTTESSSDSTSSSTSSSEDVDLTPKSGAGSDKAAEPSVNPSPESDLQPTGGGQGPEALGIPTGAEIRDASRLTPAPGNQAFTYPQQDRLHGRTGTATVVGRVEADGSVTQVALEKSSGSKTMDQEALSTFRKWKFMPGQEGYVRKPVQFVLAGEAQVSKSTLGSR